MCIRDSLDIVRLTDTVETANTLLQQIRVERQIEHYQVAGKLEVTAFGANFRTPVSYTHLDVYKRQVLSRALTGRAAEMPAGSRRSVDQRWRMRATCWG